MTAAEQARVQLLHAGVDAVEGVLEAAPGFAVDLLDRAFQCFQCRDQIVVLRVQVLLALLGFAVFGDGGQVDGLQPADAGFQIRHGLFPCADIGVVRQFGQHLRQLQSGRDDAFVQPGDAQHQTLFGQAFLLDRLTCQQGLLVGVLALGLVAAHFRIDAFDAGTGRGQVTFGDDALFQEGLTLGVQRRNRGIALGKLRSQFGFALLQLLALGLHAQQRLIQRGDLGTCGFQFQCDLVRGIAGFTCGAAGGVALFGQVAALAFQRDTGVFLRGHQRQRGFQTLAGFACALLRVARGLFDLRQLGIDACQPAAGRFQLALLALHLAGEFGHAAVRQVQRTLRVLALLFGLGDLFAQFGDGVLGGGFALGQFLDFLAQRLDVAFAQQCALPGTGFTCDAQPARAEPVAAAGHDRFVCGQRRQQTLGGFQIFGGMDRSQPASCGVRSLHPRGE